MRFERHGGPPDLEAAFKVFVVEKLRGRALDDNWDQESARGQFPDFACFGDLVLIEMKHLEADQSDRLNDVLRQKIDPAELPFFYGARDANLIMDNRRIDQTLGTHHVQARQGTRDRNAGRRADSRRVREGATTSGLAGECLP